MKYIVQDEDNDMPCGFDYQSFIDGFDCQNPATKVILDTEDTVDPQYPEGFHFAHVCKDHVNTVMGHLDFNWEDI